MDYEEIPLNTVHVTGDGETDTKTRTRRLWKEKEEELLFRIWGRDNWRLTRHGKNTVFFSKWAEELREEHNIVVRPEEIQTKVNQTRSKFRQVKKLLDMDRNAPKWKKFDLVSLILKNQYRPDNAEPVPLESLEKNRDISPSELLQMAAQSPDQTNTSGDTSLLVDDVGALDVSHEQLDTSIRAFNNHNISGGMLISNGDSRREGVGDLLLGDGGGLFSDQMEALNDEEIKNNFMHYQYEQEKQEVKQQQLELEQISEDLKPDIGQLNEAERTILERKIYNDDAAMMLSATIQEMKQIQTQRQNKQQQKQHQNYQNQQQQQSKIYEQNKSYTQPSVVILRTSPNLQPSVVVQSIVADAPVSDALMSAQQPSNSQPPDSVEQDLQDLPDPNTNNTTLPRVISKTTEPGTTWAWGMLKPPSTTSMTFETDRPLISNYMGKANQKTGIPSQQSRKRRLPTVSNGGDTINGVGQGDSMEVLFLNEVKKKNMLLEEQSDISRKRLELERRKVMLMEQFFPKCLQMQEQILAKLSNTF